MLQAHLVDALFPLTSRVKDDDASRNEASALHDLPEERPLFPRRRYDQVPTEDDDDDRSTVMDEESSDGHSALFRVTTYAKQVRRIVEQTLLYRQTQRPSHRRDSCANGSSGGSDS